jgi:hypothetical protein
LMADTTTKSGIVKLSSKALSLDEAALTLLRAVERGVRVFTPDGETPEALADFQQIVRLLRMMEYRRYFEAICSLNVVPADGGGSRVDRVRLSGGLTEKGRAVLAYYDGEYRGYLNSQTA